MRFDAQDKPLHRDEPAKHVTGEVYCRREIFIVRGKSLLAFHRWKPRDLYSPPFPTKVDSETVAELGSLRHMETSQLARPIVSNLRTLVSAT